MKNYRTAEDRGFDNFDRTNCPDAEYLPVSVGNTAGVVGKNLLSSSGAPQTPRLARDLARRLASTPGLAPVYTMEDERGPVLAYTLATALGRLIIGL